MRISAGLLTTAAYLVGCSGGGGDPAPPSTIAPPASVSIPSAGRYSMVFTTNNTQTDAGDVAVLASGGYTLWSNQTAGRGQMSQQGVNVQSALVTYVRKGLNSAGAVRSPGAVISGQNRDMLFVPTPGGGSDTWYSSTGRLTVAASLIALPLMDISGLWSSRRIIPFHTNGSMNVDYMVELFIDQLGAITGTDSVSCTYSGSLSAPTNGYYAVSLTASGCTDTARFIVNGAYQGFAIRTPPVSGNERDRLRIVAFHSALNDAIVHELSRPL